MCCPGRSGTLCDDTRAKPEAATAGRLPPEDVPAPVRDVRLERTTCPVGSTVGCYSGAAGTLGVGNCIAGTATCNGAGYGSCSGEITPTAESCNGNDDNCDWRYRRDLSGGAARAARWASVHARRWACCRCVAGTIQCDATPGDPQARDVQRHRRRLQRSGGRRLLYRRCGLFRRHLVQANPDGGPRSVSRSRRRERCAEASFLSGRG